MPFTTNPIGTVPGGDPDIDSGKTRRIIEDKYRQRSLTAISKYLFNKGFKLLLGKLLFWRY